MSDRQIKVATPSSKRPPSGNRLRRRAWLLLALCSALVLPGAEKYDPRPAIAFSGLPPLRAVAFSPQGGLFGCAADAVVQVVAPKQVKPLAKGGALAGLAFDAKGELYTADRTRRAVLKITPWGDVSVAADACAGAPLIAPASIAAAESGVYFTDAGRVCRVTSGRAASLITDKIKAPAAIAVSSGGSVFVADGSGSVWRLGGEQKLATLDGIPVAMALDERGDLYVALRDKVVALGPEGQMIAEVRLPGAELGGLAFGAADPSSLFVSDAASGSIWRLETPHRAQRPPWEPDKALRITWPIDGAILNRHDGVATAGGLRIAVKGEVRARGTVRVNGAPAAVREGQFTAEVVLSRRENRITADAPGGASDEITVLWDRDSFPRYRVSTDDNIRWLKDIALHQPPYRSIFENSYLGFWRDMHRKYGSKIHFNIYYETEGFTLAQMPDRFRREWQQNADWIRLTFHARANDPDRPYIHSSADRIRRDYRLVTRAIERFAGKELLSEVTTVHWGEATEAAVSALRAEGVKVLVGYFELRRELPAVAYHVRTPQLLHLMGRDYWKDVRHDLLFVRHDMVINTVPLNEIVPRLERLAADPHQSEIIELMIHEQYWYPDYVAYLADYRERVERAIQWVSGKGYKPVFFAEGFLGAAGSRKR